jgi:putative membrane protein
MRITGSTLMAVALMVMTGVALAQAPAGPAAKSSEHFLSKALQASMVEVELGKLAQKNAQSTGVNALGARLQRDHARISKVLSAVLREKGMVVPTSIDSTQRAQVEALGAKTGADFDAAYVDLMVSNHENAIALYTAVAESGDPDLSPLAKFALPTLREDQRLAGSYENSYEKENASYDLKAIAARK